MSDLTITHPGPFNYDEATSGDVDVFAARTDALGQPTLAAWRLESPGGNSWHGSLASGGPKDSSDVFIFEVPAGREVQSISLVISNVQINSGSTFFLSTLSGDWSIERPLASFSEPLHLPPGQYSLMMGNGTLVLDYHLTLDVFSTQPDTPPILVANARNPEFDGHDVLLFSDVLADTRDAGQLFTHLYIRVAGVKEGSQEVLNLAGVDIPLVAGTGGDLPNGRFSVVNMGKDLFIPVVGFEMSEAELVMLVAGARYQHNGLHPTAGNRDIKLFQVWDNGEDGYNSTTLDIASTVTVQAVNQAPVITLGNGVIEFIENDAPVVIAQGLVLTDVDSSALASASVSITSGYTLGDTLLLQHTSDGAYGDIATMFDNMTGILWLSSAGGATMAQWQSALGSVVYHNASSTLRPGERTFTFEAFDGDRYSVPATRQLTVTLENQAPVFSEVNEPPHFTEGALPVLLGKTVADRELDALDDYDGASLLIARLGGANTDDIFSLNSHPGLLLMDGELLFNGQRFATWESQGGVLKVSFDIGATKLLVNAVLASIQYANASPNPPKNVALEYTFNDGNERGSQGAGDAGVTRQTLTVAITAVNDVPVSSPLPETITVLEGRVSAINLGADGERFSLFDPDIGSNEATVRIVTNGGELIAESGDGVGVTSEAPWRLNFIGTLEALENYLNTPGRLFYRGQDHTHGKGADTLVVTINDNGHHGSGGVNDVVLGSILIDIQPVNDAPKIVTNTGVGVVAGGNVVITQAMLEALDPDDAADGLTYTVKAAPENGTLYLNDEVLSVAGTFTQADINAGKVRYQAGNAGEQALFFSLADGGEDGVLSITGQSFTFNVTPAPIPPVPTPAPGPLPVPTPEPSPGGNWLAPVAGGEVLPNTPSGLPALREIFVNDTGLPGAVRLVENSGNANLVMAMLPGGATLLHEGARTAIGRDAALSDLVASLNNKSLDNLATQTRLSELWLETRSDTSLIDVRSLALSAETSLSSPIMLRGALHEGEMKAFEAFVIDTTGMPQGMQISLEHIDFVSIKGGGTLVGGAGESVIIGDDAPLRVILGEGRGIVIAGAGDDMLIGGEANSYLEGGGGSNRLYTKSGDDTLMGGTGLDVARFDTTLAEAELIRDDAGRLVVSAEAIGRNTLMNVELLRFDDQVVLVDTPELADMPILLFDETFYLSRNADVAEAVARGEYASGREHFERFGMFESRLMADDRHMINMAFDEAFYLSHNLDVAEAVAAGIFANAFEHYLRHGEQEGRNPNVLFDEQQYRAANMDVDAAIKQGIFESAYMHYRLVGEAEGRLPSRWFDLDDYQAVNPDVVAAGVGELGHYLQYGIMEGRFINAVDDGFWG